MSETRPPGYAVLVETGTVRLEGILAVPELAIGVVVFAHGSGSSRHSPRNARVARRLNDAGLATLLFDLLTPAEAADRTNVFDIPLLAERLAGAARWIGTRLDLAGLPIGLFGASTGAAASLVASTSLAHIAAIVSRGGRPDLAGDALHDVRAPTLLVVGEADHMVLSLNRRALESLPHGDHRLETVPGATHLFEESGAMEAVAEMATDWFVRWMSPDSG